METKRSWTARKKCSVKKGEKGRKREKKGEKQRNRMSIFFSFSVFARDSRRLAFPASGSASGTPREVSMAQPKRRWPTRLCAGARRWEANGQEPVFGGQTYTFCPRPQDGAYWVEAEVQWPDGRLAFATNSVIA